MKNLSRSKTSSPGISRINCSDYSRLNPDIRSIRNSDTDIYLARCGILYLESLPTDANGESFNYVKHELTRIFNTRNEDGNSLGIEESPIVIYINSLGGPVNDAIALYDQIMYLRKYYGLYLHTIAQGFAMSGGALILQAGTKRYATSNSILMIHGVQAEYGGGTLKEAEIDLEANKKMNANLIKI